MMPVALSPLRSSWTELLLKRTLSKKLHEIERPSCFVALLPPILASFQEKLVQMVGLSDKEMKVLRALVSDSDAPRKRLAQDLDLTEPDFSRTVKKLKDAGIIKKFTVDLDFNRLGYRDGGMLLFSVTDKKNLKIVVPRLLKYPEIIEVQEVFGADYDLVVRFMAEDTHRIRAICKEIEEWEETNSNVDQFTLIFAFTHRNERGVPV